MSTTVKRIVPRETTTTTASYVVPSKANVLGGQNYFESKTQYDSSFDYIYKEYPKAKKGLACPLFALLTASEYFKTKVISKEKHEENLQKAVTVSAMLNVNGQIMFNKLLGFTNLTTGAVMCTSTDIIKRGDMSWNQIIPGIDESYCMIFLKNAKFFVIICDHVSKLFCVRDCHESFQYNFQNKQQLIEYLNTVYYLSDDLIVGGVAFPEYSSVEYITIQKLFTDNIDQQLEHVLFGGMGAGQGNQGGIQHQQNNTGGTKGLIIKPVHTVQGSAVVGYVENAPDDGTDMLELQRKFGDEDYGLMFNQRFDRDIERNNNRRQFADANFDSDYDDGDDSDDDMRIRERERHDAMGPKHVYKPPKKPEPKHNYEEDDEFFSDDDM